MPKSAVTFAEIPNRRTPAMDASAFLDALNPYMAAFLEQDHARRLKLLQRALVPEAEICGPSRVFAGYAEISEKIDGFHKNWPTCRLVLAEGIITFRNTGHFPMAIVDSEGQVRASGHSVVELASDIRIRRVLAFWGPHPTLPESWPESFGVQFGSRR